MFYFKRRQKLDTIGGSLDDKKITLVIYIVKFDRKVGTIWKSNF